MSTLAEQGAALLGGRVRRAAVLHGGDLSQVIVIELDDGRQAIVKGGAFPSVEARMLRAIKASGAPAPEVFAATDQVLVLEAMPSDGALSGAFENLGQALARLQSQKGERYGWAEDYAFGAVAIPNGWLDDWP